MYYKEFLRVRNAVIWCAATQGVVLGIIALISLLFIPHHGAVVLLPSDTSTVNVPDNATVKVDTHEGPTNFIGLLGASSLMIGGIMATIFGSLLANENVGHLDLAWTKPHSRAAYAATAMLVDVAGIVACVLIGFVTFVLIMVFVREPVTWDVSASTLNDFARFALFPLAWFGIIVALSARLRGGGVVQGLIWPVTLVMLVLAQIPFPPVWHTLAVRSPPFIVFIHLG